VARKKRGGGHGGHGWFVTFADLMALLMSFFVMVAAYSTQDQKKLQVVAGSMRDAFGTNKDSRFAGIIEQDGIPVKAQLRNARLSPPEKASDYTSPNEETSRDDGLSRIPQDYGYGLAVATLRQALQDMPDIGELSKNIIVEDTKRGLDISIIDQDGRAMFGRGSDQPFDRTRTILQNIAPALRRLSQRIAITGHTAAIRPGDKPEGPAWNLSARRAVMVRDVLAENGIPDDRFALVAGKADGEPMFPDNPYLAANRRVTLTLLKEEPALPFDVKP
jgi:chemotaxis protein MotB